MNEIWGKITGSFETLKDKLKGVTNNPTPTPTPLGQSNAAAINGGGKRRRTKKVRFSKKHKVYTFRRYKHSQYKRSKSKRK